jgi:hypothetical protein
MEGIPDDVMLVEVTLVDAVPDEVMTVKVAVDEPVPDGAVLGEVAIVELILNEVVKVETVLDGIMLTDLLLLEVELVDIKYVEEDGVEKPLCPNFAPDLDLEKWPELVRAGETEVKDDLAIEEVLLDFWLIREVVEPLLVVGLAETLRAALFDVPKDLLEEPVESGDGMLLEVVEPSKVDRGLRAVNNDELFSELLALKLGELEGEISELFDLTWLLITSVVNMCLDD